MTIECYPSVIKRVILDDISFFGPRGYKEIANPMIWGASGIGKTQVINQIAKDLGMRMVPLHLPQCDASDIKGVPIKTDNNQVVWMPSSFLPQTKMFQILEQFGEEEYHFPYARNVAVVVTIDGQPVDHKNDPRINDTVTEELTIERDKAVWNFPDNHPVSVAIKDDRYVQIELYELAVMFLDELTAAMPDTQNAALQLVLERQVGDYRMHPYTPVISAGNREKDGAFVQPMSGPLANRFAHYTMTVNTDEWIEWAKDAGKNPDVIWYLQTNRDAFINQYDETKMVDGNMGFPTPRSVAMFADQFDLHCDNLSDENELKLAKIKAIANCGEKFSNEFFQTLKRKSSMIDPVEVLTGNVTDPPQALTSGDKYMTMINLTATLFEAYREFHEDEPDNWTQSLDNYITFMEKHCGHELTITALTLLSKKYHVKPTKMLSSEVYSDFVTRHNSVFRAYKNA